MAFIRTCVKVNKIAFYLALYIALLLSLLLGFLSYKPITLNTNSVWIEKLLNVNGSQLKLRKLKVWFDGNLNIQGEDGEIVSPNNEQVLNISKVNMSFSNAGFVVGKILPKRITLEGLTLDIHHEIEGTYIAGFPLISNKNKHVSLESVSKTDPLTFIEYLNQENDTASPYFRSFQNLSAKHVNLNIYDNVNLKSWSIKDALVNFERSFLSGEELIVEGKFTRPGFISVTPAKLVFTHPKLAKKANVEFAMKDVSSDLFDDYFPFENPVHAKGDVHISLDILEDNTFEDIYVKMAMSKGSIHVTPAYNFPFIIKGGDLEVGYDYLDDIVTIHNLAFVDKENWPLEVKGTIKDVTTPKDMKFDLKLKSFGDTTVSHVSSYLPDKKIRGAVNWIRNHVHGSKVKNLELAYYGKPLELPFCDKKCGFDGSFDYEDMSLSFLKHTEAAEGLNGHFEMKDDYIKISSKSGTVEGQSVKNLTALIAGHFTPGVEPGITLKGHISGPVERLLNVVDKETGEKKWPFKITGEHVSSGFVFIPFKNTAISNVIYDFKFNVQNVRTNTLVDGLDIVVPTGEVFLTQEKLSLEGEGVVNGLPVKYEWRENMQKPIQETVVSVWGELPATLAMQHLNRINLDISNTVTSSFNLKAVEGGKYKFEYLADLTKNKLNQTDIKWHKGENIPLKLLASGFLGKGVDVINVDVSATGVDTRLLGSFDMSDTNRADFSVFNLAGHKLKAAIHGPKVNLVGEQLNLSAFDLLGNSQSKQLANDISSTKSVSSTKNMDITLNVEKMLLPNGAVEKVIGDLKMVEGVWRLVDVKGQNDTDAFHLVYKSPSEDHMSIDLKSASGGDVLNEAGVFKSLRKGNLHAQANIYNVKGKKQGQGLIKLHKTYMVKAPVMAKILSLISLTELISSKDGIYFEDVEIPLKFVGDEIITDHAFLSGPSIGLRLRGKINPDKDNLNIEGQLIPAEGLNSLISKIPLLGDILTGSQSGLLVADFKVKGSLKDPKVSANPLSFVLPGLVKDFFGTMFNRGDITEPEK